MATANVRINSEYRRRQILECATELFASQGFEGTTTREIAEAAGVNEAIIFRHFPTKDELYWEVIETKCREGKGRARIQERIRAGGTHAQVFRSIAEDFFVRRENDPDLGRLLLFTALENHKLSSRIFRTHIAEIYEEVADYIRLEIEAGRFRRIDPLLAARGFFGMLVYHFLIQELFGGKKYQKLNMREVADTLTDIWLRGMAADSEPLWARMSDALEGAEVPPAPRQAKRRTKKTGAVAEVFSVTGNHNE
jgi:AcrR family transcriptional regulator